MYTHYDYKSTLGLGLFQKVIKKVLLFSIDILAWIAQYAQWKINKSVENGNGLSENEKSVC